jgi:hypothetical protein
MESVTVLKADLIKKVTKNRKKHRAIFLKAQEAYRAEVINLLDQRLKAARDGKKINLVFRLPEPVDYTDSYDTALEMLSWETGDEIVLDEQTFKSLVLNQWSWTGLFAASTASYLAT